MSIISIAHKKRSVRSCAQAPNGVGRAWLMGALLCAAFSVPGQGGAQVFGAGSEAQDLAFERMFAAPNDPQTILAYAAASADIRDFEAVAAALERLIALEPQNAQARFQLALAYFALGSNAMAEQQMQIAAQIGAKDPALMAKLRNYQDAAAQRRSHSQVTGYVRAGAVSSDTPSATLSDADFWLAWRQDLGSAQGNYWLTSFGATYGKSGDSAAVSNPYSVALRSGPVFALGTSRESTRVGLFGILTRESDIQGEDLQRQGAGLSANFPVGERIFLAAEASFGLLTAQDIAGQGWFVAQSVAATYRMNDRNALRARWMQEDRGNLSSREGKQDRATIEMWHEFRPSFSSIDRNWRLVAQVSQGNSEVTGSESQDTSGSLALRFWVSDQVFSYVSLSKRQSSGASGTESATQLGLRLGWEF